MSDSERASESNWVLHTPYAAPDRHWELDEQGRAKTSTAPGRRPSSTQLPVPNPRGDDSDWTPPVPVEPQDVYTLPGREHLRLRFPHLAGYARGGGVPRWSIDPRDAPRRRVQSEPRVGAVFDDLREPGAARTSDTGGVRFRTTLRYWYDGTAKSELNAAACHSRDEARLAEILDRHPDVEAWVRNFRLGWTVPWYDSGNACWSRTEPDFVARSKTITTDGRRRHLVIEFKGLLAGEASEEQKRRYLEERWAPAVSRRPASNARAEDDHGDWRAVWIEDIERAGEQIARACRG